MLKSDDFFVMIWSGIEICNIFRFVRINYINMYVKKLR